jgi:hypothetical protein
MMFDEFKLIFLIQCSGPGKHKNRNRSKITFDRRRCRTTRTLKRADVVCGFLSGMLRVPVCKALLEPLAFAF